MRRGKFQKVVGNYFVGTTEDMIVKWKKNTHIHTHTILRIRVAPFNVFYCNMRFLRYILTMSVRYTNYITPIGELVIIKCTFRVHRTSVVHFWGIWGERNYNTLKLINTGATL